MVNPRQEPRESHSQAYGRGGGRGPLPGKAAPETHTVWGQTHPVWDRSFSLAPIYFSCQHSPPSLAETQYFILSNFSWHSQQLTSLSFHHTHPAIPTPWITPTIGLLNVLKHCGRKPYHLTDCVTHCKFMVSDPSCTHNLTSQFFQVALVESSSRSPQWLFQTFSSFLKSLTPSLSSSLLGDDLTSDFPGKIKILERNLINLLPPLLQA